ncbi:PH domain-containing protein [Terrabacter sp. NPDC080008]|uniref:PH domain-containing protein n=1 Tax=Terrabacter sp. NPDC080008 TaxID=3155176 RepID=UPI00344E3DFA
MGFPENVLAGGERVERDLHPHWLTVVAPTLFGLLLAAACIAVAVVTPDDETGNWIQWVAVAVLVIVAIPAVAVPYLRWRTTHYVITSHRVMVRRGILTKTGKDITLSKITDVSFEQSLLDRMIGSGSLHLESAGDSPDEDLANIPHSNEVQQLVNRLIDEDDLRRRSHGRFADDVEDSDDAEELLAPRAPDRPVLAEERRRHRRSDDGGERGL